MAIDIYLSVINTNDNRLNAPTKRHRLNGWVQKHKLYICYVQETNDR